MSMTGSADALVPSKCERMITVTHAELDVDREVSQVLANLLLNVRATRLSSQVDVSLDSLD